MHFINIPQMNGVFFFLGFKFRLLDPALFLEDAERSAPLHVSFMAFDGLNVRQEKKRRKKKTDHTIMIISNIFSRRLFACLFAGARGLGVEIPASSCAASGLRSAIIAAQCAALASW